MARIGKVHLSAGLRRGLLGQMPTGSRKATSRAECRRVLAHDDRPGERWKRRDALQNFHNILQGVIRCAASGTMLSMPGHDVLAAENGVSEDTVARVIDVAHEWGYLYTVELGTTAEIREAQNQGQDPHPGHGNRRQVYQVCVPIHLATGHDDAPSHDPAPRNADPSSPERSEGLGSTARRAITPPALREPHGYARTHARVQRKGSEASRPSAGRSDPRKSPRRRGLGKALWITIDRHEVHAVWAALPAALTSRLAGHEAERLVVEIARQLDPSRTGSRSVPELIARIQTRWEYWKFKLVAGLVQEPVAAAFMIVRRGLDCVDVRCEDGWQLDRQEPCQACALVAEQITLGRQAASWSAVAPEHRPSWVATPPAPDDQADSYSPPPVSPDITAGFATLGDPDRAARHATQARKMLATACPNSAKVIARTYQPRPATEQASQPPGTVPPATKVGDAATGAEALQRGPLADKIHAARDLRISAPPSTGQPGSLRERIDPEKILGPAVLAQLRQAYANQQARMGWHTEHQPAPVGEVLPA